MHKTLDIVSYNCHSVRNNIGIVREILQVSDIVILQELMLNEADINFMHAIDKDFEVIACVKDKVCDGIASGRPAKGVAIMCRKKVGCDYEPLMVDDRIIGVHIIEGHLKTLLLNVYLPCDCRDSDSLDKYLSYIAILDDILQNSDANGVILTGDFNADHFKNNRFWKELSNFILKYDLYHVTSNFTQNDFTYLCPATNSTSFLDHIFCTKTMVNKISNVRIMYELGVFDHFPVKFSYDFDAACNISQEISNENLPNSHNSINWEKVSKDDIHGYKNEIIRLFDETNITLNCFKCKDFNCKDKNHFKEIDKVFSFIIYVILIASSHFQKKSKSKCKVVPGWNQYVKENYNKARLDFLIWKDGGKIIGDRTHGDMINSRKQFKSALKFCKRNENKIRDECLAENLKNKNIKSFWQKVRMSKSFNVNKCNELNTKSDPYEKANEFSNHFKGIFAESIDDSIFNFDSFSDKNFDESDLIINLDEVLNAIDKLNVYNDFDGVSSYHVKYAPDILISFISEVITVAFKHTYLPSFITKGIITPIIKDKFDNISNVNNYRPIIQSSIFLKIIEHVFLNRLKSYYEPNVRQHGFRHHSSTLSACLMLKETVYAYILNGSGVYTAFLDFSKAFDKVNFNVLFQRMINLNIPVQYVKFIHSWYTEQYVKVNFNGVESQSWRIKNGVRQGGILSPFLFNICIDVLLNEITSLQIGCRLGHFMSNIIAYADDVVVLAPSKIALQKILDVCNLSAKSLKLSFNTKKICVHEI